MVKQVEVLNREMHKTLKEIQEHTSKQVKELNKKIQELKMERETIKKTQREATMETDNLGKITSYRCKHHQQTTSGRRENLRHIRYHRRN